MRMAATATMTTGRRKMPRTRRRACKRRSANRGKGSAPETKRERVGARGRTSGGELNVGDEKVREHGSGVYTLGRVKGYNDSKGRGS
jgi:hypothetical protein